MSGSPAAARSPRLGWSRWGRFRSYVVPGWLVLLLHFLVAVVMVTLDCLGVF
jgi:hypothetical protein